MSKRQDGLVGFYISVLRALSIEPRDDGSLIHYWVGDEGTDYTPMLARFKVNGENDDRQVFLPTATVLKQGGKPGTAVFHPHCEVMFRGESEMIGSLKKYIEFRVSTIVTTLATRMMELATDEKAQKKMGARQSSYLEHVPKADERSLKVLFSVLDRYFNKICKVHIVRSRDLHGVTYRRVAGISFPLLSMLDKNTNMIGEVKAGSKQTVAQIHGLLTYILDNHDTPDAWCFGTNDESRPNFMALMMLLSNVGARLNKHVKVFQSQLRDAEYLTIDLSFTDQLDDLDQYVGAVPPMEGNQGTVKKGEVPKAVADEPSRPAAATKTPPPAMQPAAYSSNPNIDRSPPPPVAKTTPTASLMAPTTTVSPYGVPPQMGHSNQMPPTEVAVGANGRVSWTDLRAKANVGQPQPMGMYPQPQPMGMYPQQQMGMYPQQQPMNMYQQPQPMGMYPQQQPMGMYPQQQGMYPQQQQPMNMYSNNGRVGNL